MKLSKPLLAGSVACFSLVLTSGKVAAEDAANCSKLAALSLPNAEINVAEAVPAGQFTAPDGKDYAVPAMCRVHGTARPAADSEINFEVWLPTKNWNGRSHQWAQGGLAGWINYEMLAAGAMKGYAMATTDDGHKGDGSVGTEWALGHPDKIIDFGYRSLRETALKSQAIVTAYYGKPANYDYLSGCSRGGTQTMQGAQRFPDYWDGILAGAPVISWTGMHFGNLSNMQPQLNGAPGYISPAKRPAIQKAAQAACTPEAHLVDGIAADPRFCRYDPEVLLCDGEETDECLTAPQVATLKRIYKGAKSELTGKSLYPGFEPSMEAEGGEYGGWAWMIGDDPKKAIEYGATSNFLQTMVFDDMDLDFSSVNLGADAYYIDAKPTGGQPLGSVLNPSNTDLSGLQNADTKLLMYIGWGDEAITPESNIAYYENVVKNVGSLEKTQEFYRFFLAPGMLHCWAGPGPYDLGQYPNGDTTDPAFSAMAALEAWVENGEAPTQIIAKKYVDDEETKGVAMTRPVCAYPEMSVYKGKGSTKEAENFTCVKGAMAADVPPQ